MKKINNKGFTLIELIVAISIMSLIITMGYRIVNKSSVLINEQQNISNNQSIANLVDTYLTKDIEQSKSIGNKEDIDSNTYRYVITQNDGDVEYRVVLSKYNTKKVYSLSRIDSSGSIEIVTNQLRNSENPFDMKLNDNGTYEVKILYTENEIIKEYSFSASSRLAIASNSGTSNPDSDSDKDDVSNEIKPSPDDMPQLPDEIGPNTHFIGFWMANPDIQKENNIYTWIDKKYASGVSNKYENEISADIRPGNNGASEYSKIENTKVSGAITGKSTVEEVSIYVSKGAKVEDFEIVCGQGSGSIKVLNDNAQLSGKISLSGGSNSGTWYSCEVTGKINTFEVTSGRLSINKEIVDSGYMLIVYSKSPIELGDADIIFEYCRNSEPMNAGQFNMTNTINVRSSESGYDQVDIKNDNAFNTSIQTRISNYTNEGSPNILLMTEKSSDKRINSIYGVNIQNVKKIILTLEGNIFLTDTSGMTEIVPNKQYEFNFTSGTNFDRHIKIENLKEGETGLLKINLVVD